MRIYLLAAISLVGCGVDSQSKSELSPSAQCAEGDRRCNGVDLDICDESRQWVLEDCDILCGEGGQPGYGECGETDSRQLLCLCTDGPADHEGGDAECEDGESYCRGNRLNYCEGGDWGEFRCTDDRCREAGFLELSQCGRNPGASEHACLCDPGPWNNARECMVDHCLATLLDCGLTCTEYTVCWMACAEEADDDQATACVDTCVSLWLNSASQQQVSAIVDCSEAADCTW